VCEIENGLEKCAPLEVAPEVFLIVFFFFRKIGWDYQIMIKVYNLVRIKILPQNTWFTQNPHLDQKFKILLKNII
jgi:hypothetical protein